MNPSPFDHNLNGPQKINRVTITVTGPAGSGKSALGNFILAALRAQGFQAGVTDPQPDNLPPSTRLAQNMIVGIEVKEPQPQVDVGALQAKIAELEAKLVKANQDNLALQHQLDDASNALGFGTPPPEVTGYQVSVEAPKKAEEKIEAKP